MKTVAALLLLFLVSCGGGSADREELGRYLKALDDLRRTDLEESAVSAFAAVSGPKHRGDKPLYQALQRCVLPNYSEFYNRLLQIRPANAALSNLHFRYTEGARYQLLSFSNMSEYLVTQDQTDLQRFRDQGRHAASLINGWKKEMDKLLRQD